jgi:hypothetical protein
MLGVGEEEKRFDGGVLEAIDGGDGLLVFKVFGGSDAADDDFCSQAMAKVDGHSLVGGNLHGGAILETLANEGDALLEGEHIVFVAIDTYGDNDLVEQRQHPPQDGLVASGKGVEGPWEKS